MNVSALVKNGLVSYWTFDRADITGKNLKDVVGQNDGAISGAVNIVEGQVGEAMEFNGVDNYVDCGIGESFTAIKDQLTLELWINADPAHPARWSILIGISKSGVNTYVIGFTDQKKVDCNLWNGTLETWPYFSNGVLSTGKWHHIATVYDGKEAKIYIDGALDNTKKFSGDVKQNGENFWIGARKSDGLHFMGLIDEARFYNRALSVAEVEENMNAQGLAVAPARKLALTWGGVKRN
jgi:hypothetical protein